MPEDLDPKLLRAFAQADGTLPAEAFVSAVTSGMQPASHLNLGSRGLSAIVGSVLGSLAGGLLLPLRLRQTRLLTLGAAAMTLWAAFV
jgi:hypothetical protein